MPALPGRPLTFLDATPAPRVPGGGSAGPFPAGATDDRLDINEEFRSAKITAADLEGTAYANRSAAMGSRYQGAPAYVCQADLLGPIAPTVWSACG